MVLFHIILMGILDSAKSLDLINSTSPMLGLGAVSAICELAWKQGNDLYSAYENRALLGYEYTVKYNLGYDVPFETWTDVTGKYCKWDVISKETKDKNGGVDTGRRIVGSLYFIWYTIIMYNVRN